MIQTGIAVPRMIHGAGVSLPGWLESLLHGAPIHEETIAGAGIFARSRRVGGFRLIEVVLGGAAHEDPRRFESRTRGAYEYLARSVASHARFMPVRFWNFIPQIHAPQGRGLTRYMVFNCGRYDAFRSWFGDEPRDLNLLPTATGVGYDGDDLRIACLSTDWSARPIENPRQQRAYCYSKIYGPKPPCFSRATVLDHPDVPSQSMILVGGTASVVGETSKHADSLDKQISETLENMAWLVAAAQGRSRSERDAVLANQSRYLAHYRQLVIYLPNPGDAQTVWWRVREACPAVHRIEIYRADLCRPELRVEIEGLADASCNAAVTG